MALRQGRVRKAPTREPIRPPDMAKGASCATGTFFDQAGAGTRNLRGVCRRRPNSGGMGSFPVVNMVDWCGDFERRS